MEIGVGLPTAVIPAPGRELLDWARTAEESGFASLSVGDRLVWPGIEPLVALAAAAAVTRRIRLAAEVIVAPLRGVALLAEQTAAVHHLSGGRLVLGVAAGIRTDDYALAGAGYGDRGRRLDDLLDRLRAHWRDGRLGPPADPPPAVLVGGRTEAALQRMARHGDGTVIVAPPPAFAARAARARQVWQEHGRPGAPRLVAHAYYALGPDAGQLAGAHLTSYYGFLGPMARMFADSALTSPEGVVAAAEAYREAGADEFVLVPCGSAGDQLSLLADVVDKLA